MKPNFKPPFNAFVKKQHKPLQLAIEDAVEDICDDPTIGEAKTGDLAGIRVYKFKHQRQEYLVAYRPPADEDLQAEGVDVELLLIDFYQVGSHENFYSTLKKYLKS
ncbi:type II toxin-antitoxin system RelE/ParE family toxin [Burkholderia vietnamiensis]|uniref:type II toxin-antitoxin system RelE/ParE family toxin n=1 Tax=Burkholderia vietnamiensis TaxID=60552 RepID=UPI001592FFD1|nr:type II toxin-antitoxin system RelE/ParE family toxin [Burkholderia vietnamiensis]